MYVARSSIVRATATTPQASSAATAAAISSRARRTRSSLASVVLDATTSAERWEPSDPRDPPPCSHPRRERAPRARYQRPRASKRSARGVIRAGVSPAVLHADNAQWHPQFPHKACHLCGVEHVKSSAPLRTVAHPQRQRRRPDAPSGARTAPASRSGPQGARAAARMRARQRVITTGSRRARPPASPTSKNILRRPRPSRQSAAMESIALPPHEMGAATRRHRVHTHSRGGGVTGVDEQNAGAAPQVARAQRPAEAILDAGNDAFATETLRAQPRHSARALCTHRRRAPRR